MDEAAASDGTSEKRQFLVHIDADLIRRTKILAIERRVTASSLVQTAVAEFLSHHSPELPSANPTKAVPCS